MFGDILKKEDKKDSGELVFRISKDLIKDMLVLHGEGGIKEIASVAGEMITHEILTFVEYLKSPGDEDEGTSSIKKFI